MKLKWWTVSGFLMALFVSSVLGIIYYKHRLQAKVTGDATLAPQCGHWCIRRCCELLGVPVELPTIVELMPPSADGHSMLQMAAVLQRIGLETEGRKETVGTLAKRGFPCIVHLKQNHFIVVSGIENGRVHLFDGWGRRSTTSTRVFQNSWSGNVLLVRRSSEGLPLPAFAYRSTEPSPQIQFDALFIDKGDVPADGESIPFVYRFKNIGRKELVIKDVHPDCTCIKAEKPDQNVPPGESGKILLLYRPERRSSQFFHEAVVECNDPVFPILRLKAAGMIDAQVRVSPDFLDLGEVVEGQATSVGLFINYTGDRDDFSVDKIDCFLDGMTAKIYSAVDQELNNKLWYSDFGARLRVSRQVRIGDLTFLPPDNRRGAVEGTVVVHTNVPRFERISIRVTGRIVPPVKALPSILTFGEVHRDEHVKVALSLLSVSGEPFRLLDIGPNHPDLHCNFIKDKPGIQNDIHFSTTGALAIKLSGTILKLRVEMVSSGKKIEIPLPVYALNHQRDATKK